MSAFTEFSTTGEVGPETLVLLYRTVRAVGTRYSYPTPDGGSTWTVDAVQEQAHDFLTGPRGLARVTQLHVQATNDESFERLMHTAVRNQFRTDARRTTLGKLIRRVSTVLDNDQKFRRLPGGLWALAAASEDNPPALGASPQQLLDAAWAVEGVTIRRWRPDASHQTTGADGPTIARLAAAVLAAAGGPLLEAELARTIGNRLGTMDLPATIPLDAEDPTDLAKTPDRAAAAAIAADIWKQLSVREQLLVPLIDSSAREAAGELDLGSSQSNAALRRARATLHAALLDVGDPDAVLHELLEHALNQTATAAGSERDTTQHDDVRRRGELT